MTTFSFKVKDVFILGAERSEVTLIGPPLATTGGLSTGSTIMVPVIGGEAVPCRCTGFPLVNLGPDRIEWVRVTVRGVAACQVLIGGVAARAD